MGNASQYQRLDGFDDENETNTSKTQQPQQQPQSFNQPDDGNYGNNSDYYQQY